MVNERGRENLMWNIGEHCGTLFVAINHCKFPLLLYRPLISYIGS